MQMLEDCFGLIAGESESASSLSAVLVPGIISQRSYRPSAIHNEAPPSPPPRGQPLIGLPPRTYKTQGPVRNEEAHGLPTSVEEEGMAITVQNQQMSQEENGSLEGIQCAGPLDTVLFPTKRPFNHANTAPGDLRQCCYGCRKVLVFALMEKNGQICKCRKQKARHYST